MKVIIISGSFPPMKCGVGDYVFNLVQRLSSFDAVEVLVITSLVSDLKFVNDKFTILPIVKKWDIFEMFKLSKKISCIRADIVHIQYPTLGYKKSKSVQFLPLIIKLFDKKAKLVQTWHDPFNNYWKGKMRFLPNLLALDGLVVVEPGWVDRLPWLYRKILYKTRRRFIPVASTVPSVKVDDVERMNIRSMFNCREDEKLLSYFGFVSPRKNIELVLTLLESINSKLILICDLNPSNQYHKQILELINQKNLNDRVFVTGFLPAVLSARYMAASDAVILPFKEGVSQRHTSFLAAVAQGVLVVTTSDKKRGYFENENVFYAPIDDLQAMIDGIKLYAGRKIRVKETSNYLEIAKQHIEFYKELLENNA